MALMRILKLSKNDVGKMPLNEFWELITYYNNPEEYVKPKMTSEDVAKARQDAINKNNMFMNMAQKTN